MSKSENYTALRAIVSVKLYFKHLFSLEDDTDLEGTTEEIRKNVEFRGANLWTLAFAILIASIGLNINSTAVIIGAMLISPLMGPIVGIGFSLGTNDYTLLRKALKNLITAVVIAIFISTIYFFLSPFKEAQSELLARTNPTAFDVFIAILGGLTGIIAASRKSQGNAVAGVAIATALMPPLCTAGFGLATGQWMFAIGALYLFLINSLFIAVSTLVVVKFLNFPPKNYANESTTRRIRLIITILIVSTVIPSVFTLINIAQEGLFYRKINGFLESEFKFEETAILVKKTKSVGDSTILELTLYGKYLPEDSLAILSRSLEKYQLNNVRIKILQQGNDFLTMHDNTESLKKQMLTMNQDVKFGILEELYKKNDDVVRSQEEKISLLESELFAITEQNAKKILPLQEVIKEVNLIYPQVKELSVDLSPSVKLMKEDSVVMDSVPRLNVVWHKNRWLSRAEQKKLVKFVSTRLKIDSLKMQSFR